MSDSRYFSYEGEDIIPNDFRFLNWTVVKVNNDTELNHILKLMEWHHVVWVSGFNPTKWNPTQGGCKVHFPFYLSIADNGKLCWSKNFPEYYYRPIPTEDFMDLYNRERPTHEDPREDMIHITRADLLDLFKKKAYEVGYNYLDSWRLNNKHIAEVIDSIPKYEEEKS